KAVQPFEIKKRKIDIFRNYEANGFEKNQRKFENFSTLISKKSRRGFTQKTNCSIGQTSSLICVTRKFLDVLLPCLICRRICLTLIVSSQIFTLILILLRYKYLETFPSSDIIHLTKYLIKESAMYRDSAKARVAARDLRRQQVKLFKLGATITLCAFLISQLADMIF
uniref:hypothetical protein n=1 Tax=Parasutterella excrementihominis TaxID=487175 RepID=UPI00242EC122